MTYDDQDALDLDCDMAEDTVHCDLCGCAWDLCGNGEGIVLNGRHPVGGAVLASQIKLCIECGIQTAAAVDHAIHEHDLCEHGVIAGDWCAPCNEEYKRARIEAGDEP